MYKYRKILTISVAAYNSEKYLVKCLDSFIRCKELDKLEVLVINDGSTDSTRQIAEEYQERYPNSFTVINKENGGHGSTINISSKLAKGKYYKIVDADDWVDSDGLDKLVRFLESATADLVINPYTKVNTNGGITQTLQCVIPSIEIEFGKEYAINKLQNAIIIEMHASTFRTEILRCSKRSISEHCYYVDVEYILYPLQYVQTVAILDYAIYRYLVGTSDQSMNPQNMVARRMERLHVVKELVSFYNTCDANKELIRNRLIITISILYETLFRIENIKVGKEEVIQFDNYLKENYDLYTGITAYNNGKSMLLLRCFRKIKFRGYGLVMRILHALGYFI